MRRFIFSSGILSAALAAVTLIRQTRRGPFTWQVGLLWLSWGISLALAISSVVARERQDRL
jgi:hypothetical protein